MNGLSQPENLFDPRLYDDVRRPHLEARTLPRWCYTSDAFHRREVERIFLKTWTFIDRVDAIPAAGDYLTVDTFAGPIIVLRDDDGNVRAFANTCRHRGARLLEGCGNRRAIVCPYHAWTYGLDGSLRAARAMERTTGFDRAAFGLKPIRLEAWGGFMFVNFDEEAQGLHDYLGDLVPRYAGYRFDEMVCTRRTEYDLACNWKLIVENAHEDYHTPTVHKDSLGMQETFPITAPHGNWDGIHLPLETSVAVLPGEDPVFPHIAGLEGDLAKGTYFTLLYPSTQFACVQDCMWWIRVMPRGPARCAVQFGFCFPGTTAARPAFEQEVERCYRRWDTGIEEDNATGELQQAGLESLLSEPGPMSWKEPKVHAFAQWVLDRVLDD